jgi:hypothetical protein
MWLAILSESLQKIYVHGLSVTISPLDLHPFSTGLQGIPYIFRLRANAVDQPQHPLLEFRPTSESFALNPRTNNLRNQFSSLEVSPPSALTVS